MTLQVGIVQFSPISFYFKLNGSVRQLSDILNCVALLWLLDFVYYTVNNTCIFASFGLNSKCARFQTGNSLITLQKWFCEVWSWRLLSGYSDFVCNQINPMYACMYFWNKTRHDWKWGSEPIFAAMQSQLLIEPEQALAKISLIYRRVRLGLFWPKKKLATFVRTANSLEYII